MSNHQDCGITKDHRRYIDRFPPGSVEFEDATEIARRWCIAKTRSVREIAEYSFRAGYLSARKKFEQ